MYETYVGQLPTVLLELSKPSIEKAYDFGLKILGLFVGWFVLLFCVELVLRIVVLSVGFVVRNTIYRGSSKSKARSEKDNESRGIKEE